MSKDMQNHPDFNMFKGGKKEASGKERQEEEGLRGL